MIRRALLLSLALALPTQAGAACYADYKAKRDDPLRLHYGVIEVRGDCAPRAVAEEIRPKLAREGWELLTVVGTFDESGLEERRDSAGDFFLRY